MMMGALLAVAFLPTQASLEANYKVPEWYEDAKFGIFCHWGVQCVPEAGDWYAREMYDPRNWKNRFHREHYGDPKEFGFKDLIPLWTAKQWNPDELCALWQKMGARYVVAMVNHHDGFDNFDSSHQPWNSVNMGPKRDIIGEWAKATRAHGMRFGGSFHASHTWSWMEPARDSDGLLTAADGKGTWWEGYDPQQLYWQAGHEPAPDYMNLNLIHKRWTWGNGVSPPSDAFAQYFKARTLEAAGKYEMDVIYYDDVVVPFWPVRQEGWEITAEFYNMNAARHDGRNEGVVLGKNLDEAQRKALVWDVERGTPPKAMARHWQTDTCIGSWHYDRGVYERNRYKSAQSVLRTLADVVSKNGNLLLSVPIRADGSLDEKEIAVCEDIAAWMKVNGEAIFDTVPWTTCGDGPQIANAPPLSGIGFNENKVPRPTKDDVRYTASKDGETVWKIALVAQPAETVPACPSLTAAGFKPVERLAQVKDLPSVWKCRRIAAKD